MSSGLGSQHVGAASAEDEEQTLMQPLGQTAATHSGQSNSARAGSRDQPSALPSSRSASTGSDPFAKTTFGSGSAASSGTRTPAQHQNRGTNAGGASSSSDTGAAGSSQSVNTRQQPLGDGESEADIGDYDSRAFGSDSSSSSSTSGFGQSEYPRLVASDTLGTDSRSFAAGSKGGVAAGSRSGTALGDDLADSSSFGLGTGSTTKITSRSGVDLADSRSFSGGSGAGSTTKTTSGFGDGVADSRSFGVDSGSGSKSTSGFGGNMADGSNSRVRSGFGDEDEGDSSSFMAGRDPTNPSSVVGAQQGFTGQPHAVQQRTSAANAGVALMPFFSHLKSHQTRFSLSCCCALVMSSSTLMPFAPCSTVVFACTCTCQFNSKPQPSQLSAQLLTEHSGMKFVM